MWEHYLEHAACIYAVFEPSAFVRGEKQRLWQGCFGKKRRTIADCVAESVVIGPQIAEITKVLRFFVAPTQCDKRFRVRAESAIAKSLYATPVVVGEFQDTGSGTYRAKRVRSRCVA